VAMRPVQPAPVPTLSQWMLLALSGLLAAVVLSSRRRLR